MKNRKLLYGYHIRQGEIAIQPNEAVVVKRIITLYIDGLSYQKIADALNDDGIPFDADVPLWNKHKVKRLLENPRYTGMNGYPAIVDTETFQVVQRKIRSKTEGSVKAERRLALLLKEYLRCGCGGSLHRTAGPNRRRDTLYLKCGTCDRQLAILDAVLLAEVSKQMAEHNAPTEEGYTPSSEVLRLTNAVNRGLEHPDQPENIVSMILQGVSARFDCCPTPIGYVSSDRPPELDFKFFGLAVSHITIPDENAITVHFK